MASADETTPAAAPPDPSTALQPTPTSAEPPAVPLPPPVEAPPPDPAALVRTCRQLDGWLIAVVLLFAFLSASFLARNADLFRHMATGRAWLAGTYKLGDEPFSWTADDTYWVNPSWLFDVASYWIYQQDWLGGVALVVLKALAVTALAGILILTGRRPGQSLLIPLACTALAILAMSPRLYLQPTFLSLFFLGLTLWLLRRPRLLRERQGDTAPPSYLSFWLLPPLFALWANIDDWFILGPLTVGLYLAGEAFREKGNQSSEGPDTAAPGELRTLGIALAVGVAACCLNPFGYHVFTLPEQLGLSEGASAIKDERLLPNYFLSPVDTIYWMPSMGLSVAGLAFFGLVLLGVASFVLATRGTAGKAGLLSWRLLVWLAFSLLATYTTRAIPFFAIVSAPIMALNFLDLPAGEPTLTRLRWSVGLRAGLLAVCGLALVATWPGWLQARPHQAWRVAWGVTPDASLEQAASQIKTWREQGLLPKKGMGWVNFSPEVGDYLAWFSPNEKGFFDTRLHLFPTAARQLAQISRAFVSPSKTETPTEPAWEKVFHERNVEVPMLILTTSRDPRALLMLGGMLSAPAEWTPCAMQGSIAIMAWKDPAHPSALPPQLHLNFLRLAFGNQAEPAPPTAPEWPSERHAWWKELWSPPLPASESGYDEAQMNLFRFLVNEPVYTARKSRTWSTLWAATLVGLAARPGNDVRAIPGVALPQFAVPMHNYYDVNHDSGPPESLYLAIRAARRAIATNWEDPRPYVLLGKAYQRLWRRTRERRLADFIPSISEIRRTQVTAALNEALRLDLEGISPTNAGEAHTMLAEIYENAGFRDLAVQHIRAKVELDRQAQPPGEDTEDFNRTMEAADKDIASLERDLKQRRDHYEVTAANKSLLEKVQEALNHGLGETAVDLLLTREALADPRSGPAARNTAIELLLNMGRLDEARDLLNPDDQPAAPAATRGNETWLQARLAAAVGDYERLNEFLEASLPEDEKPAKEAGRPRAHSPGVSMAVDLAQLLLREASRSVGMPMMMLQPIVSQGQFLPWPRDLAIVRLLNTANSTASYRVQYRLTRAWLALEAGDIARADTELRAVQNWLTLEEAHTLHSEDPSLTRAGAVLELYRRCQGWIDAGRK